MIANRPLSNSAGAILDPIFSLRRHVRLQPGTTARIAFWTLIAPSRKELMDLVDKHHDAAAFDRATTLAWTQAQVQYATSASMRTRLISSEHRGLHNLFLGGAEAAFGDTQARRRRRLAAMA